MFTPSRIPPIAIRGFRCRSLTFAKATKTDLVWRQSHFPLTTIQVHWVDFFVHFGMFDSSMTESRTIVVTVDKSHLLTLGERMYVEAIELIRELVANAYDADAMEVHLTIAPDVIVVEDDGSGMDYRGLQQFFTIGSEEKRVRNVSPRFGRQRIGQFGIGKFAALAAADEFRIETKRNGFVYAVKFNKDDWQGRADWALPVEREPATSLHRDGTRITMTKLRKRFSSAEVERFLRESVPLRAKKFSVFVNGNRLSVKFIPGRRVPVRVKTFFGMIEGEIVVAQRASDVPTPGIECRARQVLIRREFFGLEQEYAREIRRVAGSVNADFLPVTAGRDDFIRDSIEFQLFLKTVRGALEQVLNDLRSGSEKRILNRVTSELTDALLAIRTALKLNPDLTPSGAAIARRRKRAGGVLGANVTPYKQREGEPGPAVAETGGKATPLPQESKEKTVPPPKPRVIKKIRIQRLGISVGVVPLGSDGPEAVADGNIIYVNLDHPLYTSLSRRHDQFSLHLLRLITQEIVLMKRLHLPAREAFEFQSKLLTDAIVKKE